jgi:hypothetical protein
MGLQNADQDGVADPESVRRPAAGVMRPLTGRVIRARTSANRYEHATPAISSTLSGEIRWTKIK